MRHRGQLIIFGDSQERVFDINRCSEWDGLVGVEVNSGDDHIVLTFTVDGTTDGGFTWKRRGQLIAQGKTALVSDSVPEDLSGRYVLNVVCESSLDLAATLEIEDWDSID